MKVRGRDVPQRGWILEMKRNDPSPNLVGSVVLESIDPLPPLKEIIPIIENAKKVSDSFDAIFLSELTRSVRNRLGELPRWYYKDLGRYYREGEIGKEGVFSEIVAKILNVKRVKPERNDSFGDWLNHFAYPYYFRSYKDAKLFMKRGKSSTFRVDRMTEKHGRVIIEGVLEVSSAKVKVIAQKPLEREKMERLENILRNFYKEVHVVQGGAFLGYR